MSKPKTVIIAGFHRCGTSYVSRCFSRAGIPMWHREPGKHAECQHLLSINERELDRQGLTFRDVSKDPTPNHDFIQELTEYKSLREGAGAPVYGFKEPRIASLIDAYLHVWPDALYVVCWRNSLQAGASWFKRNNCDSPLHGAQCIGDQMQNFARAFNTHDGNVMLFDYNKPNFSFMDWWARENLGVTVDFETDWRGA